MAFSIFKGGVYYMTFIGLEVDLQKLKIFNLVLQDMCIIGLS